MDVIEFPAYVTSLSPLSAHVDPDVPTPDSTWLRATAASLSELPALDKAGLSAWLRDEPPRCRALGLSVGLSQERLKNTLRHRFGTSSWNKVVLEDALALVEFLDDEYGLIMSLQTQINRTFDFGDILVARAGTRVTATRAGASGRHVEDEIEQLVRDLGLSCVPRTRFEGRNRRTAPCDVAIPGPIETAIAIAAKGFDSTGSKLSDAVREIEEMADVRKPTQFIYAVIDGIGWKSRLADLRRIYELAATSQIDGMYTLQHLPAFRRDLEQAARLRGLT